MRYLGSKITRGLSLCAFSVRWGLSLHIRNSLMLRCHDVIILL